MAPQTIYSNNDDPSNKSSGLNTPNSELESVLPVHPTAARRPYSIQVQSENTTYTDEHIFAKFNDRGASVELGSDGSYKVTPTVKSYEFRTETKVPKTGYVSFRCPFSRFADIIRF
jgi:myo-inositol-1-phosphate synthase